MNENAGIYIRLSEMDDLKKFQFESESVENQRMILLDFLKDNNLKFIKEYVDDGYSGANFNRPAFKEMMEDLKNGLIDTIVVKDLSRFGRDHIMTGYYLETFFPLNNYRFISALEKIDSQKQKNDYNESVTFVMACNDYFSKQNSLRIRTILQSKRRAGKYVGSVPPFGYMRDPEDKGHLIPDPNTAHIIREMFQLLNEGKTYEEIAKIFNKKKYVTVSVYKHSKKPKDKWYGKNIKNLKINRLYTGDMVQGKETVASYKSDKKVYKDPKDWDIVENTHEPLVDKDIFWFVQDSTKCKEHTSSGREKRLFENLIYCKECGSSITYTSINNTNYLQCSYNKKSTTNCCSHYMLYDKFEKSIIKCLKDKKIFDRVPNDRKKIQDIIYSIVVDKTKLIKILFKNNLHEPIEVKYK